jgi:hypothetical protein
MGPAIAISLQSAKPWGLATMGGGKGPGNPLTGLYKTADQRFISVGMYNNANTDFFCISPLCL